MATLPGRCSNEMFCSLAASGTVVHVPADGPFVCPHCGKVMEAPSARRPGATRAVAWFGAGVLFVMIAAFVGGVLLGAGWWWPFASGVAALSTSAVIGGAAEAAGPAAASADRAPAVPAENNTTETGMLRR